MNNMELWIRSQDKNNLIKVYNIWIDYTDMIDKGHVSIMTNSNFSFELGIYNSKERALKVLDELQQRLIDLQTLEIEPGCCQTIKRNINCVYEMPKD